MLQPPMRITIGSPATGNNYYPRNAVVNKLERALQSEHVLFLAPRRTGKTSVLLNLQKTAPARAVFLDLEGFNHPAAWIKAMTAELSKIQDESWLQKIKQASGFLHRFRINAFQITEASWEEQADSLLQDLHTLNEPVWFLLDEFPTMIDKIAAKHSVEEASAAMHWLRRSRQQNTGSPVRFLLTGSIGLDSVLRRHGIRGPANDLRREILPPLSSAEALELAIKLAQDNGVPLNESLAQEYIQRLGPAIWPYFIQLFVAELQDRNPQSDQPVNMEEICRTVAHGRRNQYSENMWIRLGEVFNDAEAATARELLKKIAAQEPGIPLETLRTQLPQLVENDFFYVLDVLQHDGYLIEGDDGYLRFFSHLLRDYWRRKGRV